VGGWAGGRVSEGWVRDGWMGEREDKGGTYGYEAYEVKRGGGGLCLSFTSPEKIFLFIYEVFTSPEKGKRPLFTTFGGGPQQPEPRQP
jgi:hypothetical protein